MTFHWLKPKTEISESDLHFGVRMLLWDGAAGWVMAYLTTGPFLIGFALLLGVSNTVVGLIAAIGPLAQTLQVPSVYLVEKLRWRKALVVGAAAVSRSSWIAIALLPFILDKTWAIPWLLMLLVVHFGFGAVSGCGFNSWMRDLVPDHMYGALFGKRLALATAIGVVLSLGAGYGIDQWRDRVGQELPAYSIVFCVAAIAGFLSVAFLMGVPEPKMAPSVHGRFRDLIAEPVRDRNFRQVLIFLAAWSFALNFAGPFFAVYLIRRIGLNMTWVLGLTVFSQAINILFFQLWGLLGDRIGNKRVLGFTGLMFVGSFLIWPFTTLPDPYALTIPLLLLIHGLSGISTAGVNLCTGNLALKLAPLGKGGSYLAMTALVTGLGATLAPILAGLLSDRLDSEELSLTFRLASQAGHHPEYAFTTLSLRGLDFIFLAAFVFGLYALHRLLSVQEIGDIREKKVHQELLIEMQRLVRRMSTAAGIRQLMALPPSALGPKETRDIE